MQAEALPARSQPAPHIQLVRRAVGVIRVSHTGKRKHKAERFVSPVDQEQRIRQWCDREGIALVGIFQELDVSGGRALERRPGLLPAVEHIEARTADVLVVAYFDRLVRSLATQTELLTRVEAAGGSVVAMDVGQVSTLTSAQWLSATMHGMMAEYMRRQIGEKTQSAKANAIERGVPTFPTIPPGYRRAEDGRLVIEPTEAEHVRRAFEMRADGDSIFDIKAFLNANGIERTYRSTQTLLASRVVLGEIASGKLVNAQAHEPIVERGLWQRVQNTKVSPGKRVPSERLLARLGILRCATCNSAMGVTFGYKQRGGPRYWKYVCGLRTECSAPAVISASMIETVVADAVKRLLADESESASVEHNVADAERILEHAQAMLDAAIVAFTGIDAATVNARLTELQGDVQAADERLRQLRAAVAPALHVNAAADWDTLSVDGQRALIRAVLERVAVRPGRVSGSAASRGAERITIEPFGQ